MSGSLPVAVIGAGPVGLAAAAHLLQRGETPIVFEASDQVGGNIRQWSHVRMFSPWEFTVDRAMVDFLKAAGWQAPPADEMPTGGDLIERYMRPFAELPLVRPQIHFNARVTGISRRNIDKMKDIGRDDAPFIVQVEYADGAEAMIEARAVIDASGTWQNPNPLGSGGLPAAGERANANRVFYGIPDLRGDDEARYANKRVMTVGSGHSAINALLELVELQKRAPQTRIIWVLRNANLQRIYGGGEDDALPARGQLGVRIREAVEAGHLRIEAPFRIRKLALRDGGVNVTGETSQGDATIQVDEIIAATGSRPDLEMLRELRLALDPALESAAVLGPLIDPNIHSCGTVPPHGEAELRHPEKNFYVVGMKSYGRAPTFLLATGYEQVRSVVAGLVGDWEAARDVQLCLPETGVCSVDYGDGGGCCAPASEESAVAGTLVSVANIPVSGAALQLQPVALQTAVKDCGCDDDCCSDGARSTSCGCDANCCS
jgi:thioredoxin reductase